VRTTASADGLTCAPQKCDAAKNEVLLDDGTCFEVKKTDKKAKPAAKCPDAQYRKDGKCADCEPYTRPNKDLSACEAQACTDRQRLKKDGSCVNCRLFTKPSKDQRECIADKCTGNQILRVDGTCNDCDAAQKPAKSRLFCVSTPKCAPNQIISGKACAQCGDFKTPDQA